MFGGDDDFFDIFPDIDGDGDHDIVDFLILDEIDNEIQREIEAGESRATAFDIDEDDDDILLEYGIDRDDYDAREEYLEAVREAKYGWRDDVEDGSEYGLDPEDYETLEDYEEALEDARMFSSQAEVSDDEVDDSLSISIPLSFSIEVSYPGKDKLEEIKESDYPNKRTYDAAYALCEIEHGDPYIPAGTTKEAEAERHKFVLSQSCIAARYLTRYDGFIFVQAIKDNFKLPIEVPNEDEEVKNFFPDFFMELAEEDVNLALDVWLWCIKEFGAYQKYMENSWTLYNHILSSLDEYPEELRDCLINRLGSDQSFRKALLSECKDTPYCVPELIVRALQTHRERIAQVIFIAAMMNANAKSKWKEEVLKSIISDSSNWEELETMESFQTYILPIAEKIDDKRIQRVLPKMVKEVEDYIRSVESSEDKYQFSRRFAWRATCVDGSKYGISPLDYETEQEYLDAIEDYKYGWRKYLAPSKLRYAKPQDYETAEAFHAAVREAFNKETKARAVNNHNENDRNIDVAYNFKIKLSQYQRVIALVDTEVHGKFYLAGSHFVTFDRKALPPSQAVTWLRVPDKDDDKCVSCDGDDTLFALDDLSVFKISHEIADRGHEYYMENRVRYISIDGTKGYAVVEGTEGYEVEFTYDNGQISHLICSCFCSYNCKHEFAVLLQLRETLDLIEKNYASEYAESGYFAAICKGTLFKYAIDGKEAGYIEI